MATSNKAISAYIPPDLEEYLTKYCTEYDITRKDKSGEIKPALGTAVVEILKVFFSSDDLPSPLPDNVPLLPSNVVTEDRLNEILSSLETSGNVPSNLPSNVVTQDDLSKALSRIPSIVNEQLETAIAAEINSLRNELQPIIEAHQKTERLAEKLRKFSSEFNARQDVDTPTITKVDKKSLAPIFETLEDEPEAIQKQTKDKTPSQIAERENEPNTEGKMLSSKEAIALAVERGYEPVDKDGNPREIDSTKAMETFRKWFSAKSHKGKARYGIKKASERGKYLDIGYSK